MNEKKLIKISNLYCQQQRWLKWFFLFCITLASPLVALGALITDFEGDVDGFGGEVAVADPPDGSSITCCFDNRMPNDPSFTDVWSNQFPESPSISYAHDYSEFSIGTFNFATLTLQTAGMGNQRGPWDVLFNGVNVGVIGGLVSTIGFTEVVTSSFNIPTNLLLGTDQITLSYSDTTADGYAINYSRLDMDVELVVPEPSALMLLLLGIPLMFFGAKKH